MIIDKFTGLSLIFRLYLESCRSSLDGNILAIALYKHYMMICRYNESLIVLNWQKVIRLHVIHEPLFPLFSLITNLIPMLLKEKHISVVESICFLWEATANCRAIDLHYSTQVNSINFPNNNYFRVWENESVNL